MPNWLRWSPSSNRSRRTEYRTSRKSCVKQSSKWTTLIVNSHLRATLPALNQIQMCRGGRPVLTKEVSHIRVRDSLARWLLKGVDKVEEVLELVREEESVVGAWLLTNRLLGVEEWAEDLVRSLTKTKVRDLDREESPLTRIRRFPTQVPHLVCVKITDLEMDPTPRATNSNSNLTVLADALETNWARNNRATTI